MSRRQSAETTVLLIQTIVSRTTNFTPTISFHQVHHNDVIKRFLSMESTKTLLNMSLECYNIFSFSIWMNFPRRTTRDIKPSPFKNTYDEEKKRRRLKKKQLGNNPKPIHIHSVQVFWDLFSTCIMFAIPCMQYSGKPERQAFLALAEYPSAKKKATA